MFSSKYFGVISNNILLFTCSFLLKTFLLWNVSIIQYKEKFHNCTCQNILFIVYQEEKKRAALVARANQEDDEDLGWGDEDEGILSIYFSLFVF